MFVRSIRTLLRSKDDSTGLGAEIVLLLDRSRSMDQPYGKVDFNRSLIINTKEMTTKKEAQKMFYRILSRIDQTIFSDSLIFHQDQLGCFRLLGIMMQFKVLSTLPFTEKA